MVKQSKAQRIAQLTEHDRREQLRAAEVCLRIPIDKVMETLSDYNRLARPYLSASHITNPLYNIQVSWEKFDYGKLSTEQLASLYKVYAHEIPAIMEEAIPLLVTNSDGVYKTGARMLNVEQEVALILVQQYAPQRTPLIAQQAELTFAVLPALSPAITAALTDFAGHWEAAIHRVDSVEERFFLEQVVETYLPDMWAMFTPFMRAAPDAKAKAERLLLEQIALLDEGLTPMLHKSVQHSLNALTAHRNFLAKRVRSQASLTLPPGQDSNHPT